jgi:hypothetical protein
MDTSPATISLLSALDAISGKTLMRRDDLALLLDLGMTAGNRPMLDELGFYAKFIDRTQRIMKRIGREAQGYDTLARELNEAATRVVTLLRSLVLGATEDERTHFGGRYFPLTPEGFENLLALCHDLGWYKNWLIDSAAHGKSAP